MGERFIGELPVRDRGKEQERQEAHKSQMVVLTLWERRGRRKEGRRIGEEEPQIAVQL